MKPQKPVSATTRRDFLKSSGGAAAGAALASGIAARAYAGTDDTVKVALIGCGGRGTGAALNALSTKGPVKLWAMADVFQDRLNGSLNGLTQKFKDKAKEKLEVPPDRQFLGMDGYKKAMETLTKGDLVLLTTPPGFRPIHFEHAVEKNLNVFMEKSFAVDAPGVRRVLKAGQEAEKRGLKVAGGLMSRHYTALEECIKQLHDGAIGDLITLWAYREHGPVGFGGKGAGMSDLAHQIRNYSCFTWLNGSFLLDWLIHNLDVCCWAKNAWPVSAQGQGGRQARTAPDQLFDHYAVEYSFADGTRLFAQGRHMDNCWGFFGDIIHGAKGSVILGEGQDHPRIYKAFKQTQENLIWEHKGPGCDKYQNEHDVLFDAIRNAKPYNEAERCAYASMVGILGRMACESGQTIAWDQALKSNVELAPGLDQMTMDSPPPIKPDEKGRYPVAVPGQTKVL